MKIGLWIELDFPTEGEEAQAALHRVVSRTKIAIKAEDALDDALSTSVFVINETFDAMHDVAFPAPPEEGTPDER